jgi:hypothetical protein
MRDFLIVSFICVSGFGQNPKIEVAITSITTFDISDEATEYHIKYQIKNTTENTVSFFLIPNALIANTASSLTLFGVYKMYQNGIFEDMDGPFFEYETEEELEIAKLSDKTSAEAKMKTEQFQKNTNKKATEIYTNYKNNGGQSSDFRFIYQRQKILDNIQTLKPLEAKTFTIKTLWNKNRFVKNEDLEYYLNSDHKIEMELILELKTSLFADQLEREDLEKVNNNPNFLSGSFVSNKFPIPFLD